MTLPELNQLRADHLFVRVRARWKWRGCSSWRIHGYMTYSHAEVLIKLSDSPLREEWSSER